MIIFAAMRPLYMFVWWCLSYSLRLFYKKIKLVNPPNSFFGRTIYVSNHPASFMDPLVVACFRKPIVFFMTRSDVFTPLTKPLLWLVHMLPIYRQLDGVNTKEKNDEVFLECSKVLKSRRNLLVFAEGFTDDVFIRRLKPIKKGAVRIGFSALEYMNWSEKIYIAAVGCNYTDPNLMRSDLLISTSENICLNDYREAYETNPSKVISELTVLIERKMREQITHVENPHLTELHEQIMMLTRKGMNAICYKKNLSLEERYTYSKNLAHWINQEPFENLEPLKEVATSYFQTLKRNNITEDQIWRFKHNEFEIPNKVISLVLLMPFFILGAIHCALPYIGVKYFVEHKFKRAVFWGSTKMLLSMIIIGLVNIPVIFLFENFLNLSNWWGLLYYLLIGLFGLAFYVSISLAKEIMQLSKLKNRNLKEILDLREKLVNLMKNTIPNNYL